MAHVRLDPVDGRRLVALAMCLAAASLLGGVASASPPIPGLHAGAGLARGDSTLLSQEVLQASESDLQIDRQAEIGSSLSATLRTASSPSEVTCSVYGTKVSGRGPSGAPVTVRVSGADGSEPQVGRSIVEANGWFTVTIGSKRIVPGDLLEVDLRADIEDPLVALVPTVSAMTDADRESVVGEAPPGARIVVTVAGSGLRREIVVGADGRFVAHFSEELDIEPPMRGRVEIATSTGIAFSLYWASLRTHASLGDNRIWGNGAPGRQVSVVVSSSDGALLGHGDAVVDEPPEGLAGSWSVEVADIAGMSVSIEPGDVVDIEVGDDRVMYTVPRLTGAVHTESDSVTGSTDPGLPVSVTAMQEEGSARREVVADGNGFFHASFDGDLDLSYGVQVSIRVTVQRQRVSQVAISPGLELDLYHGTLRGMADPVTEVVAQCRRGTALGPVHRAISSGTGAFTVSMKMCEGPTGLLANDVLELKAVVGGIDTALMLTVPDLSVTADAESGLVHGRASPTGALWLGTIPVFERPRRPGVEAEYQWGARPHVLPSGEYSHQLGLTDRNELVPGYQIVARYVSHSGHVVIARHFIAIVNLQVGGASLCGYTAPAVDVRAELRGVDSAVVAAVRTSADDSGRYSTELLGTDGEQVTVEEGHSLKVWLGEAAVEFQVPSLQLEADWSGALSGNTLPDRDIARTTIREGGCFAAARGPTGSKRGLDTASYTSDSSGDFHWLVPPSEPGQGFELAVAVDGGHRVYRQVLRGLAEVYLFSNEVAGVASPHTKAEITVTHPHSGPIGTGDCRALSSGTYRCMVDNSIGQAISLGPTQEVELTASDEEQLITVEKIDFDFDTSMGVLGVAPPHRRVELRLVLKDGRTRTVPLVSDASGAFAFSESDLPPRSDWTLNNVVGIHAALATPNGHWIVRASIVPHQTRAEPVFVPLAVSRA